MERGISFLVRFWTQIVKFSDTIGIYRHKYPQEQERSMVGFESFSRKKMASKALVVQFLPDPVQYKHNQPRDRETAKRIRSHIAGNLRRKKLQVLLNPTGVPLPSETEEAQVNGTTKFCTCVILQNASPSKEDAKSKVLQKQRAIADSYKICQRCHKVQFLELSWLGQLKAARQRIPSVTPFLESEFDPFESLPELAYYKQTPQSKRMLNEIKAHCK